MPDFAVIISEGGAWIQANHRFLLGCLSGLGLLWVMWIFGLVGPFCSVNDSDTPPGSGGHSSDDCGDDGGD